MREEPKPAAAARVEYLARIHRVTDHIERHLDERLALEDLARVACFSPFHFHRVFTACAGEPLYRFILRLRLEKAANQLAQNPGKSIIRRRAGLRVRQLGGLRPRVPLGLRHERERVARRRQQGSQSDWQGR